MHPHITGLATAFFTDQVTTSAESQSAAYASSGLSELLENHAAVTPSKEGSSANVVSLGTQNVKSQSPRLSGVRDLGPAPSDHVGSTPSERHEMDSPMELSSLGLVPSLSQPFNATQTRPGPSMSQQTVMRFGTFKRSV